MPSITGAMDLGGCNYFQLKSSLSSKSEHSIHSYSVEVSTLLFFFHL